MAEWLEQGEAFYLYIRYLLSTFATNIYKFI